MGPSGRKGGQWGCVFEGDIGNPALSFPPLLLESPCLHEVSNFVLLCTCFSDRSEGYWLKVPAPEGSETDPDKTSGPLGNPLGPKAIPVQLQLKLIDLFSPLD